MEGLEGLLKVHPFRQTLRSTSERNLKGGPDRADGFRKVIQIKPKQAVVSYFRTVRTFLEEEVATLYP